MDRFNIQCLVGGKDTNLQLDKKAMPGESGPCFMITADGCFKGYISRERNGTYKSLGTPYYSEGDLKLITQCLSENLKS
jgi:hypothetical protein